MQVGGSCLAAAKQVCMLKSKLKKFAPFRKRSRSGQGSGMGNCAGSGQGSQGKGKGGGKKVASSSSAAAAGERGGGKRSFPSAEDSGTLEASKSSHGEVVLE